MKITRAINLIFVNALYTVVVQHSANTMRILLAYIILILLNSCGANQREDIDGWQLASDFHTKYANEFIQNDELIKYSYNPRSHFYLNTFDEGPSFRALIHDTTKLRVVIFENQGRFIEEFGFDLDTFPTFDRATVWTENGELKIQVDGHLNLNVLNIEKNPLEQFNQFKKLLTKYGIVTYGELRIGRIIRIYFTAYDYLLYFPTNYKIDQSQFEEYWRNKKKQGKQLDQNWYYYQSDKPLDFG